MYFGCIFGIRGVLYSVRGAGDRNLWARVPDPGPGMSRTKALCKALCSAVLDREWAGMSWDSGRDLGLGAENVPSINFGQKFGEAVRSEIPPVLLGIP